MLLVLQPAPRRLAITESRTLVVPIIMDYLKQPFQVILTGTPWSVSKDKQKYRHGSRISRSTCRILNLPNA